MPSLSDLNLLALLPATIIAGWACLLLLLDLAVPRDRKHWTAWLALAGVAAAFVAAVPQFGGLASAYVGLIVVDGFTVFLNVTLLAIAAITILISLNYLPRMGIERGEFHVLLLFTLSGMMLMAAAADLIVVFLALELLSIPLYVLAGFARPRLDSEESAMKYFLLGAFASGFLVYGIALTYGAAGSTSIAAIVEAVRGGRASAADPLLLAGSGLILVGLGFKVAAVPFHMWTPDVYEGAPSVVTAFMSVGAKAGGFAALLRIFFLAFPALAADWVPVVAAISTLTMILGNFVAIAQSSIKRMLAYSSIAHAGYILMALVAGGSERLTQFASGAALFYLLGYAVTNLGTWAVVIAVERAEGAIDSAQGGPFGAAQGGQGLSLDDYAGLGAKRPGLALAMALFMLSLTGLPPTVGFVAKFYVFRAALDAGFVWLALVGVLTSLVSAYYYLRVVIIMYMREGEGLALARPSLNFAVGLTALATFLLGVLPGPLMALATRSMLTVLAGS